MLARPLLVIRHRVDDAGAAVVCSSLAHATERLVAEDENEAP
jgi:hypothetical protein